MLWPEYAPKWAGILCDDNWFPWSTPMVHTIAGHLGGPHEVVELPVSHTELPEEQLWYDCEA